MGINSQCDATLFICTAKVAPTRGATLARVQAENGLDKGIEDSWGEVGFKNNADDKPSAFCALNNF